MIKSNDTFSFLLTKNYGRLALYSHKNIRCITCILVSSHPIGYCSDAIDRLFTSYETNARALKEYKANLQVNVPPPLAASYQRPDRDDLVQNFISRYARSSLVH